MAQAPRGIVLTGQQEAWAAGGGPGKFWEDKPNAGYSGTPLWRLHAERDARIQAEASPAVKIPDGFKKHEEGWYWSDKSQMYWREEDQEFYVWDAVALARVRLHESKTYEVAVSVGGVCHERAAQVRHVLVRDLARAAQALRMSIEHLDQPCAMQALYDGHRGGQAGNACAEFCAKQFHTKLLPKLAAFRGYWSDMRLKAAVCESFEELDASFVERHPGSFEGCSAAVALVLGRRLIVATIGDTVSIACLRSGETLQLTRAHAIPDPDVEENDDDDDDDEDAVKSTAAVSASEEMNATTGVTAFRWTRALGDHDFKVAGRAVLSTIPDVAVLELEHKHQGFALVCRALYASIGGSPAVATVFRRCAGRPRMAAGALVDAAVQWLGEVSPDCGLAAVVAFFDKIDSPEDVPTAKRRRTDPVQIRLRHILLKHRECKSTIDKVRNKQVRRTRGEAERILRGVLEECAGDKGWKVFSQRCRELSECQSCLKAGDLVGDIGWVKRGAETHKLGEGFDAAVFSLQVNQLSDLVDSEQGFHVVLRTA